jgi:hypothetical protein
MVDEEKPRAVNNDESYSHVRGFVEQRKPLKTSSKDPTAIGMTLLFLSYSPLLGDTSIP